MRELIAEEGNDALKLRVYIQGGGCSGFQYGFEFDEAHAEDDLAIQTDGVTLLVDPLSLQYLMGAEVDYTESLHGAQFVIRNPERQDHLRLRLLVRGVSDTRRSRSPFVEAGGAGLPPVAARWTAPIACATTPTR